jgi:hypothetical protein
MICSVLYFSASERSERKLSTHASKSSFIPATGNHRLSCAKKAELILWDFSDLIQDFSIPYCINTTTGIPFSIRRKCIRSFKNILQMQKAPLSHYF